MNRSIITQRKKIIKTYYNLLPTTYHVLRGAYGLPNRPTTQAIGKIVKKIEKSEVVANI